MPVATIPAAVKSRHSRPMPPADRQAGVVPGTRRTAGDTRGAVRQSPMRKIGSKNAVPTPCQSSK
jgi:hypothetical protein